MNKNAFTLAEILIAIGVIGIVSAITIPTLTQVYRRRVVETKLQKFYSMINQAVKMSEIDNGDKESWNWDLTSDEYTAEYFYNNYLKNYISVLDVKKFSNHHIRVFLKDGSAIILDSAGFKGGHVYFCLDGANCRSSYINSKLYGRKIFTFGFWQNPGYKFHYGKGIEPYMLHLNTLSKNLYNGVGNVCCSPSCSGTQHYCAAIIKLNNWKIPKDYPFKL